MTTTNLRFVTKNGLNNNGNSITNIGVSGASLTQAGAFAVTLTATATTNVTLPTSGTLISTASGTAPLATSLAGGTANQIPYQTGAGVTSFYSGANYGVQTYTATGVPSSVAGAAGVLQGSASAIPTFTTTPTLTGTNFTGIPNGALTNSSITIGSTSTSLGGTSLTLAGLTSVTSGTFIPSSGTAPTNGLFLPAANAVGLATNSTEALRINSSQNVVIGPTTTQLTKLDVATTLSAGTVTDVALFSQASGSNPTTGQGARIYLAANSSITRATAIEGVVSSGTNGHHLAFLTNANGAVPTEKVRIDSTGNVFIGTSTQYTMSGVTANQFQLSSLSASAGITSTTWTSTSTSAPDITFLRSKGTTEGTHTVLADGDAIGFVRFGASDGTQFLLSAGINVSADGASSTNNAPSKIQLLTAPDGGAVSTVTITTAGSGYTDGSYTNVTLTTSTGIGRAAVASITVAGGVVTVATITQGGYEYFVGDTLTASATDIGGTGTGLVLTVATLSSNTTATAKVTIDTRGALGLGSATLDSYGIRNSRSITGAATSYGYYGNSSILPDVTTNAFGVGTSLVVSSGSSALSSVQHFNATQGTWGTRPVTNQYGFVVSSSLTGATSNYGFYGNLASATGRWNFYANGTALNYFSGSTLIGDIDTSVTVANVAAPLQVHKLTSAQITLTRGTADTTGPSIALGKSRSTSAGSAVTPPNGSDVIGNIFFTGADGTNFSIGARIDAFAGETFSGTARGTSMRFGRVLDTTTTNVFWAQADSSGPVSITTHTQSPVVTGGGSGGFRLLAQATGATSSVGCFLSTYPQGDATTLATAVQAQIPTTPTSIAYTEMRVLNSGSITLGASSTLTNAVGVYVTTLSAGTNNYGIWNNQASGANNWGYYGVGTAQNYFAGNVGIGTTTIPVRLAVAGTNVSFTGGAGTYTSIISDDTAYAAGVGGGTLFGGNYDTSLSTTFSGFQGFKENATAGNTAGALKFFTRPAGGNLTTRLNIDSTGVVSMSAGTASTSTTTGTLVVTGGVGASGAIYAGSIQNTPIGSTTANTGAFTTLTASSTVTLSPANANVAISPTGTGTVTLNPATASTINNMSIGATTRSTGAFTTLASNGATTMTANTTSTGTGTGTLVVTGGVGVSGLISTGSFSSGWNAALPSNTNAIFDRLGGASVVPTLTAGTVTTFTGSSTTTSPAYIQLISGNTAITGVRFGDSDAAYRGSVQYDHNTDALSLHTAATSQVSISSTGVVSANAGTASTSSTTGTVVVTGGVGISGDTYHGGSVLISGTGAVGYATGSGGAVTQTTSRTTGVTLNKTNGAITLVSAAGSATWQTFTVTNSTVAATDVVYVCQKSGTDLYMISVTNVAAGSFKISFATTGGTTTEQPVFNFVVIKAVAA